tara:strand:+ start:1265 stop:1999 length:735 start_codon:yes stop_codon:yes gene_type:complete
MVNDFTTIVKDAIINYSMEQKDFVCKYCGKSYRKESTLAAHLCEPKRRAQQENEAGVKLGMTAYLRFYELSQGSAKFKTYADFCESPYYNAFVKFGRHMVNIRAINTTKFIDWVIKSNKKLDHWCKDAVYQEYLFDHIRREATQDALERSIKTMERWAEDKESVFNHYFNYVSSNLLVQHVTTGRISPWVIFNCDSGVQALDKLSTEQIEMIFPYIDPDFWKRKFVDFFADTEWVKAILKEAGL